jgi:hypothetical protein
MEAMDTHRRAVDFFRAESFVTGAQLVDDQHKATLILAYRILSQCLQAPDSATSRDFQKPHINTRAISSEPKRHPIRWENHTVTVPTQLLSDRTASFLRRAINAIRNEESIFGLRTMTLAPFEAVEDGLLAEFAKEQLISCFSSFANICAYKGLNRLVLASNNGFLDYVDVKLQERLTIIPKEFAGFSESVWRDIVTYFERGGEFRVRRRS